MSITRYIDCTNTSETLLSLLKQTLLTDGDNWYIRVVAADDDELPLSVLTDFDCDDADLTVESIIKNLLVYNDEGQLCWYVYNTSE